MSKIQSTEEEIKKWLSEPENRDRMFVRPSAELEGFLDGTYEHIADVGGSLWALSNWFARVGAVEALAGRIESAGVYLGRGLASECWSYRIEAYVNRRNRNRRPRLSRDKVGRCLLSIMSLGDMFFAEQMFLDLMSKRDDRLYYSPELSRIGQLAEALTRQCFDGEVLGWSAANFEPYQFLVASMWGSEGSLSPAIDAACEAHESLSAGDDAEFDQPELCLFPMEIGAIRTLRSLRGLPWPAATHWLSRSPLLLVNAKVGEALDPLLASVTEQIVGVIAS